MSRWVRGLLLLILAAAGLWFLRRMVVDRAEHGSWRWPGPPLLGGGRQAPALPPAPPVEELEAFGADLQPAARTGGRGDLPAAGAGRSAPVAAPPEPAPAPPEPAPAPPEPAPAPPEPAPAPPEPAPAPAEPAPADPAPVEASAAEAPPGEAPAGEAPPAAGEPGPAANLDRVRERLASMHVDRPAARAGPAAGEVGGASRSRRPRRSDRWRDPAPDGTCDQSHPIKVKLRSGLFHLPGMFAYDRTRADRCYRSAADAESDGFTRARR